MSILFHVLGPPVPKARARVYTDAQGKSRAVTPKRTKAYQEAIGWAFKATHAGPPFAESVAVRIVVHEAPGPYGDVDNYVKAVLDGLNHVAWLDDRQVLELHADIIRHSAEPGLSVTVEPLGERR